MEREQVTDPKGEAGKLKPQLHLVPTAAVNAMAEALADGASRYGPWNWRKGPIAASVYIGDMMRHAHAYRDGQDVTKDTLVSELGAVMANCAILLDALEHGTLVDDRPKKKN
jgi:hypothetical protein